jgi:HD superfamily phosphohydrolase YqeK
MRHYFCRPQAMFKIRAHCSIVTVDTTTSTKMEVVDNIVYVSSLSEAEAKQPPKISHIKLRDLLTQI